VRNRFTEILEFKEPTSSRFKVSIRVKKNPLVYWVHNFQFKQWRTRLCTMTTTAYSLGETNIIKSFWQISEKLISNTVNHSIIIPSSATAIKESTVTLPPSLTIIGGGAFSECTSFFTIVLPSQSQSLLLKLALSKVTLPSLPLHSHQQLWLLLMNELSSAVHPSPPLNYHQLWYTFVKIRSKVAQAWHQFTPISSLNLH